MLSINTNLSSLIAQGSMKSSTNKLNQAIERMTTGFKINHAKDNAANYSISTTMTTKLNAYNIATENIAMGMDMITTASDVIALLEDKGNRLRALSIQAQNETYGKDSLDAINQEAKAIINEIKRIYSEAEYNGISLFNNKAYNIAEHFNQISAYISVEEEAGFVAEINPIEKTYTASLESVSTAVATSTLAAGNEYKICSVEDLKSLAVFVNNGGDTSDITFILAQDIDLSSESNWTPIGNETNRFKGIFDGNGYEISNLTIESNSKSYIGLFGYTDSDAKIKNLGLVDCYVSGNKWVGGLVGYAAGNTSIENCYAFATVIATEQLIGGLVGATATGSCITNCYTTGSVKGGTHSVGGLVGRANGNITNCYSTSAVNGITSVGGLIGMAEGCINNSFATGTVTGNEKVGGLVGRINSTISNSYTTGDVNGDSLVGGLAGEVTTYISTPEIKNCNSYATVKGQNSSSTGSFIGGIAVTNDNINFGSVDIINAETLPLDMNMIGGCFNSSGSTVSYDSSSIVAGINNVKLKKISTTLQVGINSDTFSQLEFNTNFNLNTLSGRVEKDTTLEAIDKFLSLLTEKSTMLGAIQNRLESALTSVEINVDNLISSRSTIRDADIAEVSSTYIQQQILQQASATLLATANQSPSIALQLI